MQSFSFAGAPSRLMLAAMVVASLAGLTAESARSTDDAQTPAKSEAVQAGQKLTVTFSDPTKPGSLKVNLMAGNIRIIGYEGKDVVIDVTRRDEEAESERERAREARNTPPGMRRIPNRALGLVVEEEHNEMRINSSLSNRSADVVIQVPLRTSLKLSTTQDGDITVDRVEGDIEASSLNGAVTLTNVSGAVIAHALNQDVKATLLRVSDKPMSFTSMNGDIDITLPAALKANVRMETSFGDVFTDFAVDMQPVTVTSKAEDNRGKGGKYVLEIDKGMVGRINGGGPEIRFKTFNGSIKLRKGA